MTAGHFGLAAGVKSPAPRVPLWALMLGTYLLDIVFIVLVSVGLESFAPLDPANPAYGETLIQAYYSHSLVGAALIALIGGFVAGWAWGKQAGIIVGGVVISHWVLDLIVHRPDLPILPGNAGNLPLLGFGLWAVPAASIILELVLVLGGAYQYYHSAMSAPAPAGQEQAHRTRALVAAGVTGLLIFFLLAADVFSLSLLVAVTLMLAIIIVGGWLDSRLGWHIPTTQ